MSVVLGLPVALPSLTRAQALAAMQARSDPDAWQAAVCTPDETGTGADAPWRAAAVRDDDARVPATRRARSGGSGAGPATL